MTFQDESVDGNLAVVRTTLLVGKGGEMSLDYRMHHPKDRWQVYDLSIDGTSLVANYRSQFNKIVRTDSYEGLVAKLKSRQAGFAAAPRRVHPEESRHSDLCRDGNRRRLCCR